MNKEPIIEIKHLRKEYESVTPLKDVSTTIYKGDIISIIGPSGTGKSTFLRCINRLETPTSGTIIVDGDDVTNPKTDLNKVRQKMGMVFQSFNLFNHKRVIENVMMGQIDLLKKSPKEAYDKALELLDLVGLKDRALNFPDELSGGQKQRVAIARTLSMDPKIILFDEPTSALDPTMVDEVLMVMKELAKSGLTLLVVTHEMNFAKNISNRIFFMDEGTIYDDATPDEIFNHPKKEKTRQFINKLKVCTLEFNKEEFDSSKALNTLITFSTKNLIPSLPFYNICLIEEEICINYFLKNNYKNTTMTIEFSQKEQLATIIIKYHGKKFLIEKDLEDIEKQLISGITNKIEYSTEGDLNTITLCIK